jgi:hypothetical protein
MWMWIKRKPFWELSVDLGLFCYLSGLVSKNPNRFGMVK